MGGPGSGRRPGVGARKLSGNKAAFGKTKGYVSNKRSASEANKAFKRQDKRKVMNEKRFVGGLKAKNYAQKIINKK